MKGKLNSWIAIGVGLLVIWVVFGNGLTLNPVWNIAVANMNSNVVFIDSNQPLSFTAIGGSTSHTPAAVATNQPTTKNNIARNLLGLTLAVVLIMVFTRKRKVGKDSPKDYQEWLKDIEKYG